MTDRLQTSEKVILACDWGREDMTALVVALEREGKIEIIDHIVAAPGSAQEDDIRRLIGELEPIPLEDPEPSPPALPYYRRFERKRRAR